MQSYTTIIGVIELRLQKQSYDIVQKRFGIGVNGKSCAYDFTIISGIL